MASVSEIMNLLNEAAARFPGAVSFMAGRPPDDFVDPSSLHAWIEAYLSSRGSSAAEQLRLGQYSDTNGVVREVMAAFLSREGLPDVTPADCMMVNGAQEGMLICLLGLCGATRKALAADPTYVGFAGAAEIVRIPVETVPDDDRFAERLIDRLRKGAGDVGCIYLVPDYANPTGRTLSREERLAIIEAAQRHGAVIVEDTAYRRYRYEGECIPTMYELAGGQSVVLIESFAKSLLPGLRIGVLLGQAQKSNGRSLADKWSPIKSYISVTTSPLTQAALAGFLLEQNYSIDAWMAPRIAYLSQSRDKLVDAINYSFVDIGILPSTKPKGGFFYSISLEREFSLSDCIRCAQEAGVLAMPMTLFSLEGRCTNMVRLAFSNVDPSLMPEAMERFSDWLGRPELQYGQ